MSDETQTPPEHRSGYVSLIGRPNVGKSTLLNALLGEKVAAVSAKPQTTRNRILGIKTLPEAQIVFLDTPGIHEPHSELNRLMVRAAEQTLGDVDLVFFLVDFDPARPARVDPLDVGVIERLRAADKRSLLLINKVDLFRRKEELLPRIELYQSLADWAAVLPICARSGDGLDRVLCETVALLPEGPQYYPPDLYTDQAERFLAAEVVREKIFLHTRQELPYASAVTVDAWTEEASRILIEATIHVERDSQKGMIIGKGGQMLRRIGTEARRDLETLLAASIHLSLFVRVEPKWRKRPEALRKLGYET